MQKNMPKKLEAAILCTLYLEVMASLSFKAANLYDNIADRRLIGLASWPQMPPLLIKSATVVHSKPVTVQKTE